MDRCRCTSARLVYVQFTYLLLDEHGSGDVVG